MIKKTFQINDSINTRLDIYLSSLLKNESRNKIKFYIKSSSVYVNGESKKPSYLLQNGDTIDISIEKEKSKDGNGLNPENIDPNELQSYYAAVDDQHNENNCPIPKENLKIPKLLNLRKIIDLLKIFLMLLQN